MRRAILLTLWLTLALLSGSGAALAHAAFLGAHPQDGAILDEAPPTVTLHFNEPVSPLVVSLTDAGGRSHRDLTVKAANGILEIAMPPGLQRGSHVLSYRVTSNDGHPIGGSVVLSVGSRTAARTSLADGEGHDVRAALWLARMGLYLGLFAGVGGSFFLAWLSPAWRSGMVVRGLGILIGIGILCAVISLGLQGADALGEPLASLRTGAAWSAGWGTSFKWTVTEGAAACLLSWSGLTGPLWRRRACSLLALCGVGLSLASSGHASAASPQWLTRPAVFLHGVGIAYWVGALLPLAVIVRKAATDHLSIIRRFSNGALVAVAALTLAGLVLAAVQVEEPANLTSTAYGRFLVAKTLLVVALLGLAALNRLWLTPGLGFPAGSGGTWLVRSVAAEMVLCVAILGAAGLWRFTPPPRALAADEAAAASAGVHLHSAGVMAQVTLAPGKAGPMRGRIVIASVRGEPIDAKEVTISLSRPEDGIEALIRKARKSGRNEWEVENLTLPLAGTWQAKVSILVDDFEKTDLEGTISVRP
jgi:copper transport protein